MRAVVLLAAALVLTGCNAERREWKTADDKHATAADIFRYGHPESVVQSGNLTLAIWRVSDEDDEGPTQAAWRLYDRDRHRLAEGKSKQANEEADIGLRGVPVRGGFVMAGARARNFTFLDGQGRLSTIAWAKPPQLKDAVLVDTPFDEIEGRPSAYNQRARRMVLLPKLPSPDLQSVQLDAAGRVWIYLSDAPIRVAYADGGRKPWTIEKPPAPKGSYGGGGAMVVSRGRVIMPLTHLDGPDGGAQNTAVEAILMRESGRWRRIPATGIGRLPMDTFPVFELLPNRRLFGHTAYNEAWLQGRDGRFRRLDAPGKRLKEWGDVGPNVTFSGTKFWSVDPLDRKVWSSSDGKDWDRFKP